MITLKDINGDFHVFDRDELNQQIIKEALTIFGMNLAAISMFRHVYMKKGGDISITADNIREVFKDVS